MFSKALLFLAVCFHYLRTEEQLVRNNYRDEIPNPKEFWEVGRTVEVRINSLDFNTADCKIEFLDHHSIYVTNGDYLLVSFVGTEHRLVINSYVNGTWQREDSYNDIEIPTIIEVEITAEENGFKITFKDKEYFRSYEFPVENIESMIVFCPNNPHTIAKAAWSVIE